MSSRLGRAFGWIGILASYFVAGGAAATTAYGITTGGIFMVRFDTANPAAITDVVAISGLQSGERIAGIDFRPRTGQLYGLGVRPVAANDEIRTYVIDAATGVATQVSAAPFTVLTAAAYGMAFNPSADRVRVVNGIDDNFRINPNNGARADFPTNDTNLMGVGAIAAAAYDRSFESTVSTTLFAIEDAGQLCTIGGVDGTPSPNLGQTFNFLALGAAASGDSGFDIGPDDDAFAALNSGGSNGLYTVNLATGIATLVGSIGGGNLSVGGLALVPPTVLAIGAEAGFAPLVRLLDAESGEDRITPIVAFDERVRRGVRVALGEVNGDGTPEVFAAPGKGAAGEVRIYDGETGALVTSTVPFEADFKGGVFVAAGDVDNDGVADVVAGAGAGRRADVAVFSGDDMTAISTITPYPETFRGGVTVATADFDNDGIAEIVTGAGKGGLPSVRVFDGLGNPFLPGALPGFVNNFLAYTETFRKGVFVAAGDVNGDGTADIVVGPGKGSPPQVAVFSGVDGSELGRFLAFDAKQKGGVRVAVGDVDADGRYEIIATLGKGAKGGSEVRAFDGRTFEHEDGFLAFDEKYRRGVFVAGVRR
jgi:hypothetical protein